MDAAWSELVHLAGIAGRVLVVYAFALVLLRVSGRRTLSQLRPIDLLSMLLLSETVSPALTGGDQSILGGFVAAATLTAAAVATGRLSFRFPWFDHLLDGRTLVLIEDGKVDPKVLRAHRITDEQLRTSLHENGVEAVAQVKHAFIEPHGAITVVKAEPG
jgi:uncharacterized membrane protein YcaP (DUF421 family)